VLGWIVLGILRRGRPLLSMAPEPVPAPEAVAA